MNPDDLIRSAFQHSGQMIGGKQLFVVEGNGTSNELRILPMDEVYINNIMAFTYSIHPGFLVLGVFTSREAAEEHCQAIRTLIRDEEGNILLGK
jgi:hypothetical protein